MKSQFSTKGVLSLGLIHSLLCTHASAQWTVRNLHPAGASGSYIHGLSATNQVGNIGSESSPLAAMWTGTAASFISLNPIGAQKSQLWATTGANLYGSFLLPSSTDNGQIWNLTTNTTTNLHPAGTTNSRIYGASGISQVGSTNAAGVEVASLWIGTPSSWVNLHPVGAAFSTAYAVQGSRQVGSAYFTNGDFGGSLGFRASLWNSTAASWTNLHPPTASSSVCRGISGINQCGWVTAGGITQASTWAGNASSWLSLHPLAASESMAYAITGSASVGQATIGGNPNASLWRGNAAGWVNIHPAGYSTSTARAIRIDGAIYQIGGYGRNSITNRTEALLWTIPVNPITRTISGNLELQNTAPAGTPGTEAISWTLTNGIQSGSGTINVDRLGGGAYSFNIPLGWPNGTYLVRMKGGTFLSSAFLVTLADTNISVNVSLRNGDIDQDGEVGPGDFELVVAQFGGVGTADVDNDDEVGPSDFETVVANFGLQDQ